MPNHLRPRRLLPADAKSLQHPPAALLATAHNAVALQQADLRQPKPDPKLQIAAALERSVAALAKLAALGLSPARPRPMRWGRASTRRLPPPYDAPSSAKGQCQTQGRCTPDRIGRQPPWPKRATPDGGHNIGGHGRTTRVLLQNVFARLIVAEHGEANRTQHLTTEIRLWIVPLGLPCNLAVAVLDAVDNQSDPMKPYDLIVVIDVVRIGHIPAVTSARLFATTIIEPHMGHNTQRNALALLPWKPPLAFFGRVFRACLRICTPLQTTRHTIMPLIKVAPVRNLRTSKRPKVTKSRSSSGDSSASASTSAAALSLPRRNTTWGTRMVSVMAASEMGGFAASST